MKLTISWLKEHLETDASVDEIAFNVRIESRSRDPNAGTAVFEFIAGALHYRRRALGTDAQPVDTVGRGQRAVALNTDLEARRVQRGNEFIVQLQERLADMLVVVSVVYGGKCIRCRDRKHHARRQPSKQ